MNRIGTGLALVLSGLAAQAYAAEKWDMPMAYPDSNFHTENGKAFAECVANGTGGELEIIVHGGGSLFKGNEIKRAVQTGQVPIGERLLSAHRERERPVRLRLDAVPRDRLRGLGEALARPPGRRSRRCSTSRTWCCSTPCPGRRRGSTPRRI